MTIKFFSTGGTIDKVYFDAKSEFQIGCPIVIETLEQARVGFRYEVTPLMRKDSLDLTEADREFIRKAIDIDPHQHIIVTHGTDTMAETARCLIGIPDKTIVLTGAMEPAISRFTDATFNIGTAVAAVQTLPPGVYIAMNGRIFNAENVRKNRAERRFEELVPHPHA